MSKRKIKTKEMTSRKGAIEAVKGLLAGLESGEIAIGEGKDELKLGVADDVKVTVKGKVKGAKVKVSVGLSWVIDGEVPAEKPDAAPAKKEKAKAPAKKEEAKPPAKKVKAKAPAKKAAPKKEDDEKKPAKKKAPAKKSAAKKDKSDKAEKPAKKKTEK